MRSRSFLAVFSVAFGLSGCGSTASNPEVASDDAGPTSDAPSADVAIDTPAPKPQTVSLDRVAVLQGVTVPLVTDGAVVDTRLAPVVVGRAGILRVFAKPGVGWKPKSVTVHLDLTAKGKKALSLDVTRTLSSASREPDLASTFNFDLPDGFVAADSQWAVTISDATTTYARFPEADGLTPLGAEGSGEQLAVRIVPVRIGGRLPDVSADALETYRSRLYALYPATKVVVDVRETPFDWATNVDADGTGWGDLLDAVVALRQEDGVPDSIYYFGAFKPADRFGMYCREGCILGLSGLIVNPTDALGRASIGVGYGDDMTAETIAHEVGHAHGRAHSPCGGAAGPDKKYPYTDASIGVFGYDVDSKSLLDPGEFTDMMGYCDPTWVSDYTFGKLAQRMRLVKDVPIPMSFTSPRHYRFVHVGKDGALTWGRTMNARSVVAGEEVAIAMRTSDGTESAVTGHYYAYGDLPGGFMIVPEGASLPVKITLARPLVGTHTVLEGIAPAATIK